jgi:hypothetical protein
MDKIFLVQKIEGMLKPVSEFLAGHTRPNPTARETNPEYLREYSIQVGRLEALTELLDFVNKTYDT